MQILRQGKWLYGGVKYLPVDIVSLDYDFWFSLAEEDDQLEPDERPKPLNKDGVLYYYRFVKAGDSRTPTWPDSGGYSDIADAMRAAQKRAPSTIEWELN